MSITPDPYLRAIKDAIEASDLTSQQGAAGGNMQVAGNMPFDYLTGTVAIGTAATLDGIAGTTVPLVSAGVFDGVGITRVPGTAANGMDVDVTRLPALVAGSATIGSVKLTDGTDTMQIGAVTAASGTTSTTGATLLSVSAGFKVRLYHVSYVPTTSATADINVSIEIGGTTICGWRTNFNGGGYMRSPKGGQSWWEGADGEDVTITLSAAQPVRWNLEYEIVAV